MKDTNSEDYETDQTNYGILFRLIPNSLIWYDVDKYQRLGSPIFETRSK